MATVARICLLLAAFLVVAGSVYGLTGHELGGTTLLLVASATFCFLGLVSRSVGGRSPESEAGPEAEAHVEPTIWPFGFSLAAVMLMLGIVVTPWLFVAGGLAFAVSAGGWFRDVARGRAHASES